MQDLNEITITDAVREQVMGEVRARFRPEFLNRIDEIILFHRLRREHMGRIVDIQMVRLAKLLEDRKITLDLDAKAREWLAKAAAQGHAKAKARLAETDGK